MREKGFFGTFSIDQHVRRDGTSQGHKYTCNKLDKFTLDSRSSLTLFDEDARLKNRIFKCSVRNETSKLNFLVRDKISFVGAQAKVMPVAHGGRSCS